MAAVSSGFSDLWRGSQPAARLALSQQLSKYVHKPLSWEDCGMGNFSCSSVLSSVDSARHAVRTAFCLLWSVGLMDTSPVVFQR